MEVIEINDERRVDEITERDLAVDVTEPDQVVVVPAPALECPARRVTSGARAARVACG